MKKLSLLVAAGAGYVLGSRAGRERYEQITAQAAKAWNTPTVQDAAETVQTQAKRAGADLGSAVGSKVAEAAVGLKDKVVHSPSHDEDIEQPSTIAPGMGTS